MPFAPWFRGAFGLGVDDLLAVPFDELRVLFEHLVAEHGFEGDAVAVARAALP